MRLVLVRHGQSTWNVEGRLQGQTMEVPLTGLGRRQADAAARRVAAVVPSGTPVWTSDQRRARETAAAIGSVLGVEPHPTPLLREQALGTMEGCRTDELQPLPVPDGVDISEVCWGGGESVEQVHRRCQRLLVELAGLGTEDVVLVGHGDALRILLATVRGRSHRDVEWLALDNGQVLVEEWAPAR